MTEVGTVIASAFRMLQWLSESLQIERELCLARGRLLKMQGLISLPLYCAKNYLEAFIYFHCFNS